MKQGDYEVVGGRLVARVHWLQGTLRFTNLDIFRQIILRCAELLGDELDWSCGSLGRGKKYDHSGRGAKGFFFAWNEPNENRIGECWLSIPGDLLDSVEFYQLAKIFLVLQQFHFKATRIDCAIDDFSKQITPEMMLDCARRGNFAGFRYRAVGDKPPSYRYYISAAINSQGEVEEASTIYFGGSGSDKHFYCYTKYLESNGEIDSIRFEARYADEQAHTKFELLCNFFESENYIGALAVVGGFCLGAIKFIDRSIGTRLDEHPYISWWKELEDCLGGLQLPVPRPVATLEKSADWSHKQWETTLRMFELAAGFENFMEFILKLRESGIKRMKSSHFAMVKVAVNDGFDLLNYSNLIFSD